MLKTRDFFNSLWPSDAIWCHEPWSTLVQVMACCLMAPSHYPNQSWLVISRALCHSPDCNSTGNVHKSNHYNEFENHTFKIKATSPRVQQVNINMIKRHHLTSTWIPIIKIRWSRLITVSFYNRNPYTWTYGPDIETGSCRCLSIIYNNGTKGVDVILCSLYNPSTG